MTGLEYFLPAALGIALAAATGFRVFLPMLITGISMRAGYIGEGDTLAWLSTTPAMIMLGIAAVAEVAAYYVPGIDNLLDTLATPAAAIAGIAVSATVMADLPPMLKWTLAIIAGGGAATMTQSATALLRGHSTVLTGGLGNHAIATGEIAGAVGLSLLAIILPWVALAVAVLFVYFAWRAWRRFKRRNADADA